jgi:hypothetical protein
MREKLEKLLALLDSHGEWSAGGWNAEIAEMRDLVVQLIAMLDGLQAELKSKSTRRQ